MTGRLIARFILFINGSFTLGSGVDGKDLAAPFCSGTFSRGSPSSPGGILIVLCEVK